MPPCISQLYCYIPITARNSYKQEKFMQLGWRNCGVTLSCRDFAHGDLGSIPQYPKLSAPRPKIDSLRTSRSKEGVRATSIRTLRIAHVREKQFHTAPRFHRPVCPAVAAEAPCPADALESNPLRANAA